MIEPFETTEQVYKKIKVATLQFIPPPLDMMHYPTIDAATVPYGSHSPNVTVMNRGASAAAMHAAAWSQNPSCRYNPTGNAATDYIPGSTTFGADPVSNFYTESYRHPLISASSAMPGVYYPSHQMLMSRGVTSPPEISISESPAPTTQAQNTSLASPTDSLASKGNYY